MPRFLVPPEVITSAACWQMMIRAEDILAKEVQEWLRENDIPLPEMRHVLLTKSSEPIPDNAIGYWATFQNETHAVYFKLRWA